MEYIIKEVDSFSFFEDYVAEIERHIHEINKEVGLAPSILYMSEDLLAQLLPKYPNNIYIDTTACLPLLLRKHVSSYKNPKLLIYEITQGK